MTMEKTDAIVLRLVAFSETSLIVTLLTRSMGRVSALAKGARRPKSPFESALDLLSLSRIVCLHKNTDALDLMTEAKLTRRFRAGESNLDGLYAGYYVSELLQSFTEDADPNEQLFDLTDRTLTGIDQGEELSQLVLRFELTALRILGHLPSLHQCVDCSMELDSRQRMAFGMNVGGVLCEECRKGKRNVVSISSPVMQQLQVFAEPNDEQWRTYDPAMCQNMELRRVMNHYVAGQMGRRSKLNGYLRILGGR